MIETFQLLTGFLTKYDDDVEGRSIEEPPTEVRDRLKEFARGASEPGERSRLSQLLKEHPQWVPFLAEAARPQTDTRANH